MKQSSVAFYVHISSAKDTIYSVKYSLITITQWNYINVYQHINQTISQKGFEQPFVLVQAKNTPLKLHFLRLKKSSYSTIYQRSHLVGIKLAIRRYVGKETDFKQSMLE